MRRKKILIYVMIIVLLIGGTGVYIVDQNQFDMEEQRVEIQSAGGKLTGTLVLPGEAAGKLGLVLFIHGDGAVNATHDDGYKPLWERLAKLGYASLSLDKRGIGGSEGSWLDQSMDDRVEEAREAIAWARKNPLIDPDRVGVWGASQAGWVIPKLAAKERLAFSILVSPAINWLRQGAYHTREQMLKDGYSEQDIQAEKKYDDKVRQLLAAGAGYDEYLAIAQGSSVMSKDRWTFVSKNFLSDAADDLRHFHSPVLLLLGEEDIHVDWKETERVYRDKVKPELLTVAVFPDAEHSMLSKKTADSELRAFMISLFAPRHITVPGYMDQIEQFIRRME
ncbi:alpha/beta fold hydrolase [Paenibacillus sp. YPG26]|uniref:alpha/beta hydrolase family protein n=1 Tax=Paenibacillus sp. YPG26 TaxID=2878915 RepID=UPI00203F5879|nr:alpha/beta fold hydrolase [Paenibacillus sp. YPG26]USB33149.1 alpha/beta fold hydrolase [Paenibacillus sp. YPG26]